MKIKTFEVAGLFGRENAVLLRFNSDMNIITGRNGSGKTTVLKLLWYILSGNILHALREIEFKKATLETSEYICTVSKLTRNTCKILWVRGDNTIHFEDVLGDSGEVYSNAEDEANQLLMGIGSSVFLPTFRRIEGGFTISNKQGVFPKEKVEIEESLIALSRRLSNSNHVFVASLSTVDLVSLLVRQYTDLSGQYNSLQQKTSQEVINKIKAFSSDTSRSLENDQLNAATRTLEDIRKQVESMEQKRETIMKPLGVVRDLVMKLFRHSGINLGKNLSFGDAANAINSELLSAGEKQMLSFICYNAFYTDSIVIIDEPELSLHVDWQRQLFPMLMTQQSTNQFVIATHSPFIYSKYPDKELQLDEDRGGN